MPPGQVIFDVLGQTDIQGVNDITQALVEGLKSLGDQQNVRCSLFVHLLHINKHVPDYYLN